MWTCPRCKESIEDQFDSCWKCAREAQPEAVSALEAETDYERDIGVIVEGVRNIRRRRNAVWILWVLFIPVMFSIGELFGDKALTYSAPLYFVLYVAAGLRMNAVRCPRCGELFHLGLSPWLAFRGRCWHCRLALDDYVP